MAKNPGMVTFKQPNHGTTGNSTKKAPGKLGFKQNTPTPGKTSSAKSPGKLGFTQKTAPMTGNSTKKAPGTANFKQPSKGGSAPLPKYTTEASTANPPAKKQKNPKQVAPKAGKFKSIAAVMKYRKDNYGI